MAIACDKAVHLLCTENQRVQWRTHHDLVASPSSPGEKN
ncbi:hypothetical protein GXM_08834 [Nostoc sphaeroides CCNUC1]|uniref:Uncharacterized protein n=1 Tax=Nostoc sphaeroides CCNUC1 TaxID=2653204 RepID=A0A5P8WFG5_9NOSO|nr:hypothetical protein GXM_08834 [Nostoc sphaeroides CCNUC1]